MLYGEGDAGGGGVLSLAEGLHGVVPLLFVSTIKSRVMHLCKVGLLVLWPHDPSAGRGDKQSGSAYQLVDI